MSSDHWIRRAFDQAGEEAERVKQASDYVERFMDECSDDLLDVWVTSIPEHVLRKFASALADNEVCEAVRSLCGTYMLNGLMIGKYGE